MANRRTLHKTHLEEFKLYLDGRGIAHRKGKGGYEVLQVMTISSGWGSIYEKIKMPEHFTVQDKLTSIVIGFYSERSKHNFAEVRDGSNIGKESTDFSNLHLLAQNDPTVHRVMETIQAGTYTREQVLCVLIAALVQEKSSILSHAEKCISEQQKPIVVEKATLQVFKIREAIKEYNTALENREHGGVAQNKAFEKIQEILSA